MKIVGELGINHNGSIDILIALAKSFHMAGCDMLKLQIRTPNVCVPKTYWKKKKIHPLYGNELSYIEYKHDFEFSIDNIQLFNKVMKENGIRWFASVWDVESLNRLLFVHPETEYIKIPSALCKNKEMSDEIKRRGLMYKTIVSLGDCKNVVEMIDVYGRMWSGAVPSYCLPCYGADFYITDEIILFQKVFGRGYETMYSTHSGRLRDIEFAKTLGYDIVEFHVTFDKEMEGSDHDSSYNLLQVSTLRDNLVDIEERTKITREQLWDDINTKLSSLRPDKVR